MARTRSLLVPLREDADGVLRIGQSRVPLETVVAVFEQGATPEEISQRFPMLELAGVYAVISYYLQNREAISSYLRRSQADAAAIRREIEGALAAPDLRERLLYRRAGAATS